MHHVRGPSVKLHRISTGEAGAPIDLKSGGGGEVWFAGAANAIGRIDERGRVSVFRRSTGVAPFRMCRAARGAGYIFIDKDGARIGSFDHGGLGDELLLHDKRPISLDISTRLVGTDGGVILDGEKPLKARHSVIDALGRGPDSMIWYVSGSTIFALDRDSGLGHGIEIPGTVRIDELVRERHPNPRLLYADAQRNVIGWIKSYDEIEEFALPQGVEPRALISGLYGIVWFAGRGGRSLFRFDNMSTLYEYALVDASADLSRLDEEPGRLWFCEPRHNAISRIEIAGL